MKRKIINPYAKENMPGHNCFGCSPTNPIGLNLQFYDNDGVVEIDWNPQEQYEGYTNVIHGGIQATLLDEVACYVVYTQCKTAGVTINLNVTYRSPCYISDGVIKILGKLKAVEGRKAFIDAKIINGKGEVVAEAVVTYFIYPEPVARKRYGFPGYEAFYK